MGKRIINLGGGLYNANIEGDYIQGNKVTGDKQESLQEKDASPAIDVEVVSAEIISDEKAGKTVNTNGANYTETLKGDVIRGDFYQR